MTTEKNDVKKVFLVNPPIQDPWRTRQEYIDEQNQAKWQFRLTILALIFSMVASFAAVISAYAAISAVKKAATTPIISSVYCNSNFENKSVS